MGYRRMSVKIEDSDVLELTLASSARMQLALDKGQEVDIAIETPGVLLIKIEGEEICRLLKLRNGYWTET